MDIAENMCYGEHCELCKTDDSQTCTLPISYNMIHYTLLKNEKKRKEMKETLGTNAE